MASGRTLILLKNSARRRRWICRSLAFRSWCKNAAKSAISAIFWAKNGVTVTAKVERTLEFGEEQQAGRCWAARARERLEEEQRAGRHTSSRPALH